MSEIIPSLFEQAQMGEPPPQSTGGFIANLLGVGPVMAVLNDPGMQDKLQAVAAAIVETARRCERIEIKVDQLIEALAGEDLNRERSGERGLQPLAAILARMGANGSGAPAATGGAPDHGAGECADDAARFDPPAGAS